MDSLELTQERSKGFNDALAAAGFTVANRRAAEFTADTGQQEAAAAAAGAAEDGRALEPRRRPGHRRARGDQAGQPQRVLHGRRRRLARPRSRTIQADNTVLKATVTYSPSMASSAISLARLIGQGKGMADLVELQVPKEIILASETITKENASKLRASSGSDVRGETHLVHDQTQWTAAGRHGRLRVHGRRALTGVAHREPRVRPAGCGPGWSLVCGRDEAKVAAAADPARLGRAHHRLA